MGTFILYFFIFSITSRVIAAVFHFLNHPHYLILTSCLQTYRGGTSLIISGLKLCDTYDLGPLISISKTCFAPSLLL